MKQLLGILLALWTALFPSVPAAEMITETKIPENPIETIVEKTEEHPPVFLNHNTLQTSTHFSISEDGIAHIYLDYTGYRNITTGAKIEISLEKKEKTGWTRIHQEMITLPGEYNHASLTYSLKDAGLYRCLVVYTVSGAGGTDDIILFEDTRIYQPSEEKSESTQAEITLPAPTLPIVSETVVSLSADASKKYIEYHSGYLFKHSERGRITNDSFFGERYLSGDFCGLYYYQPNQNCSLLFCEKTDCLHTDCAAVTGIGEIFNIGGILYRVEEGKISCFSHDQWKTLWQSDGGAVMIGNTKGIPFYAVGWRNYLVYGEYIYITAYDNNGSPHILRYHINENTMTDLTQDTGNFMYYEFIYNDTLYGYDKNHTEFVAYDKNMNKKGTVSDTIKQIFTQDFRVQIVMDSTFFGVLYDEHANSMGLMAFDIETGTTEFFANQDVQATALAITYADDNSILFLDANNRGAILQIDRNDQTVRTIYQNENMNICAVPMILLDDHILVYAQEKGLLNGEQKLYADGWYRGIINDDGNFDALEWVDAVQ